MLIKDNKIQEIKEHNTSSSHLHKSSAKPFLRWAGGKSWFIKELHKFLPHPIQNYFEPFLGGGSIFFFLKQEGLIKGNSFLSDTNPDLVNCYKQIRDNVEGIIQFLRTYQNNKEYYYYIRSSSPETDIEKAAQFIYLNRTSYNGLYRVNLKGIYNVPYGYKTYQTLFDYENLRKVNILLQECKIVCQDFSYLVDMVSIRDFIFLDPPYTVAHGNNGFVKYNQKIFAWSDQKRLAELVKSITKKRVKFLLTNAAHPSIDRLFGEFGQREQVSRFSVIGGKQATRNQINEYVFFNSVRRTDEV